MSFGGFKPLSANFTPSPNQFFDQVIGHYPSCVVTVVAILIRSTLGWADPVTGERRVEAELPLSAFLRPELCESSARKGLSQAMTAGFIVQTARASNRDGARYALRWEDAAAQRETIERARRATQDPILENPVRTEPFGSRKNFIAKAGGSDSRGLESGGLKNTPPPKKVLKKAESGKEKTESQKQTLNVGENEANFVSPSDLGSGLDAHDGSGPGRPHRSGEPDWLERQTEALVAELRDWGSERRHRQMLSICEQHGLQNLPMHALQLTRQRLAKESKQGIVEKPGAYYQRVLLALLEHQQVFVPTAGEDDSEEVRRLARESLGLDRPAPEKRQ